MGSDGEMIELMQYGGPKQEEKSISKEEVPAKRCGSTEFAIMGSSRAEASKVEMGEAAIIAAKDMQALQQVLSALNQEESKERDAKQSSFLYRILQSEKVSAHLCSLLFSSNTTTAEQEAKSKAVGLSFFASRQRSVGWRGYSNLICSRLQYLQQMTAALPRDAQDFLYKSILKFDGRLELGKALPIKLIPTNSQIKSMVKNGEDLVNFLRIFPDETRHSIIGQLDVNWLRGLIETEKFLKFKINCYSNPYAENITLANIIIALIHKIKPPRIAYTEVNTLLENGSSSHPASSA